MVENAAFSSELCQDPLNIQIVASPYVSPSKPIPNIAPRHGPRVSLSCSDFGTGTQGQGKLLIPQYLGDTLGS
jgi:hypothetical protein